MKRSLLALFGFLLGSAAVMTLAQAQTLEDALAAAYRNNPTLLAQRANLRATDEGMAQALSNWRPTVEMSGDFGTGSVFSNSATGTNRHQHRDPRSLGFTIDQPLYRGGRTVAATREALNSVQAERARLTTVEQSVLLAAATAYMDVVRDQALLELNINNEQVLKRNLEATEDRFRVGETTRTDVSQAESRLARATADRIQAEGDLEDSRATFRNVVGEAPVRLTQPPPQADLPTDRDEAVRIAVTEAPNVVAAEFDERALADAADQVEGELRPTVSLSGTAKRSFEAASETSRSDVYEAKVNLNVPLYQSGAVFSRLRAARQRVAEQRLKTDQERRDATESATQAWEALQTTRARLASIKAEIEAARIALDGVQREAAVGSRTVLDVLDAEQELLDAQVGFVEAQRDEIVAIFEVGEAMGRLTAERLGLPVSYYDPEEHYLEVRDKWFGTGIDPTEGEEAAN